MLKFTERGDLGVKIKLQHDRDTDQVIWHNGNSFVAVIDDNGLWKINGTQCFIFSINGIGEHRWSVGPYDTEAKDIAAKMGATTWK